MNRPKIFEILPDLLGKTTLEMSFPWEGHMYPPNTFPRLARRATLRPRLQAWLHPTPALGRLNIRLHAALRRPSDVAPATRPATQGRNHAGTPRPLGLVNFAWILP